MRSNSISEVFQFRYPQGSILGPQLLLTNSKAPTQKGVSIYGHREVFDRTLRPMQHFPFVEVGSEMLIGCIIWKPKSRRMQTLLPKQRKPLKRFRNDEETASLRAQTRFRTLKDAVISSFLIRFKVCVVLGATFFHMSFNLHLQ